jgi:hypothetical protein
MGRTGSKGGWRVASTLSTPTELRPWASFLPRDSASAKTEAFSIQVLLRTGVFPSRDSAVGGTTVPGKPSAIGPGFGGGRLFIPIEGIPMPNRDEKMSHPSLDLRLAGRTSAQRLDRPQQG